MKLINKISLSALTATTIFASILNAPASYAQKVVDISPASNEKNISPQTSISGMFESSEGKSVDTQSIEIYLNEEDITNESTITGNFFSYKPSNPLPSGNNVVRIKYKNNSGTQRIVEWNFNVEKPVREVSISSITHNATESIGSQSTFLATVNATPGVKVDVLLYQDGKKTIEIPTQEVSQGVYVGTYTVEQNQTNREGIVVGRLQENQKTIYDAAAQPFMFDNQVKSTEAPEVESGETQTATNTTQYSLKPTITNYNNGDRISSNGFILEGTTKPNATVNVKVNSKQSVLNNTFININLGSKTIFEDKVTADKEGNFMVNIPAPSDASSGTEYTVTATASDEDATSNPVQLTLTQE